MSGVPVFATVDPFDGMTGEKPGTLQNLVSGSWEDSDSGYADIIDPMNGEVFLKVPDTQQHAPYIAGLRSCPKSGMHNPLKNPQRYVALGQVCSKAAALLAEKEVSDYFTKLIMRVMPKSWNQSFGEVLVTRVFLENLAGDGVRFLARGFSNPGNHDGQESRGYRWPYGAVVIIAPFNFPLEIPALQLLGALAMGNRPLVKPETKVSVVFEQFVRLLIHEHPCNQSFGEVLVTRVFLENLAGDGVRFLARGFSNPGNHDGQESRGYRWPYGAVVIIAPFNFPLEIPALQLLGALAMGNRPLVKPETKVSVVFEQFVRLLIHAGLPMTDLDMIHCRGTLMGELIETAKDDIRLVQFTGSSGVAEHLADVMNGAVRIEDAGFDWKVIGPDYDPAWLDYVAWQCDEDAYNAAGQKCSAQSIILSHDNWSDALLPKLKELAARSIFGQRHCMWRCRAPCRRNEWCGQNRGCGLRLESHWPRL